MTHFNIKDKAIFFREINRFDLKIDITQNYKSIYVWVGGTKPTRDGDKEVGKKGGKQKAAREGGGNGEV